MSETKRPVGRPSIYTKELAQEICRRIADGESLKSVCRDQHMPCRETVWAWRQEIAEFSNLYAQAREMQAEYFADEVIEIADTAEPESGAVQKARLQIDTRKWFAAKMNPKKYGDKTENTVSGSLNVKQSVADLSDDELRAELAALGIDAS